MLHCNALHHFFDFLRVLKIFLDNFFLYITHKFSGFVFADLFTKVCCDDQFFTGGFFGVFI